MAQRYDNKDNAWPPLSYSLTLSWEKLLPDGEYSLISLIVASTCLCATACLGTSSTNTTSRFIILTASYQFFQSSNMFFELSILCLLLNSTDPLKIKNHLNSLHPVIIKKRKIKFKDKCWESEICTGQTRRIHVYTVSKRTLFFKTLWKIVVVLSWSPFVVCIIILVYLFTAAKRPKISLI